MDQGSGGAAFGPAGASIPAQRSLLKRPRPSANIGSMDAPNPSATPTFASRTPLHIGAIGLIARDLDLLTNYYRDLLGLTVLERTGRVPARTGRRHDLDRDRAPARRQARRSGAGRPLPHRIPDADAAGPCPLDHAHRARPAFRSPARPITASAKPSISTIPRATASRSTTTGRASAGTGRTAWSRCRPSSSTSKRSCGDRSGVRNLSGRAGGPAHRPCASSRRLYREGGGILSRRARSRPDAAARRRDVHVIGRLPPSRRRQCLAQRRRGPARRGPRGPGLVLGRGRRQAAFDAAAARLKARRPRRSGHDRRHRDRRSLGHACSRAESPNGY